jgi:hypothetical protein
MTLFKLVEPVLRAVKFAMTLETPQPPATTGFFVGTG